jgi:hypothetical protein
VNSKTQMHIKLAPGGGTAISLFPATDEDKNMFKYYSEQNK